MNLFAYVGWFLLELEHNLGYGCIAHLQSELGANTGLVHKPVCITAAYRGGKSLP